MNKRENARFWSFWASKAVVLRGMGGKTSRDWRIEELRHVLTNCDVRLRRTFWNGEDKSELHSWFQDGRRTWFREECADFQKSRVRLPHCNRLLTSDHVLMARRLKQTRRNRIQYENGD
jgi:hypothetical protein